MNLKDVPTSELVDELIMREGVTADIVAPHNTVELVTEGPVIVLEVKD